MVMSGTPSTQWAVCRRLGSRHRILHSEGADVEFVHGDGTRRRSPVLDIGAGGLSFALPEGSPPLAPGSRLERTVVRLGDRRIRGCLTIAHVTPEFAAGVVCGARFEPSTEADARAFEQVLASAALP